MTPPSVRVRYALSMLVAGRGFLARVKIRGRAVMEYDPDEGVAFSAVGGLAGWCGCGDDWPTAWTQFGVLARFVVENHADMASAFNSSRTFDSFAASLRGAILGPVLNASERDFWRAALGAEVETGVEVERVVDLADLTPDDNGAEDGPYLMVPAPAEWEMEDPPRVDGETYEDAEYERGEER